MRVTPVAGAGPRRRAGLMALVAALALGCGSAPVVEQAPRMPDARKAALGKMVRAVEQSHAGAASDEALALLTHSV